jgi:hypothetical protein
LLTTKKNRNLDPPFATIATNHQVIEHRQLLQLKTNEATSYRVKTNKAACDHEVPPRAQQTVIEIRRETAEPRLVAGIKKRCNRTPFVNQPALSPH